MKQNKNIYNHTIEIYKRKMGYPKKKVTLLYSIVVEICQIVLDIAKNNSKI